ncbi:hypothetical protein BDB01DRAFT_853929 [Pilobolus umbonatus]|nr:hypothetical protein BDB01DRAFT_853929 [Pilobolus umbonatus]
MNRSFEELASPIINVNKKLTTLHNQFTRLKEVHDSLTSFNQSFSAFLFGMTAVDATLEWKETFSDDHINRYESIPVEVPVQIPTAKRRKLAPSAVKRTAKINIRKVVGDLPLKYREQTQYVVFMETILKVLQLHPEGLVIKSIVAESKMPQYKVIECLNVLVRSKVILKECEKGHYATYKLDSSKYPTY